MSGQLVGEVLAASDVLQARELSQRGFYALIAIAEKADTHSRQASVRWDYIRGALYGASKRTAERAVQDLKVFGLVRVVRPGFNNSHGRMCAPVYEIQQMPVPSDTDTQVAASVPSDTDTQVAASLPSDTDTQVAASSPNESTDTDKTGDRYRQNGHRYRHSGVVLDVSLDGPIDEGTPPRLHCPKHMPYGTAKPCQLCGRYRTQREAWEERRERREHARRDSIRAAINNCEDCDANAWIATDHGAIDCPKHPNFRIRP